ncbi:hypothetical protein DXG01_004061 [Tephrocybe rancida]|nr:hypothetical protein DXG01_004061 [Tephrocybe rancida]
MMATYVELKADRVSHHSNRKMSEFLDRVTQEFRISWPELESLVSNNKLPESALTTEEAMWPPADVELLKKTREGRRDQIKWWFRNTSKNALSTHGNPHQSSIVLASMVRPPKKRRIHKVVEKYQMMHREKMRDLMRPWLMKYQKKYGTASLEVLEAQVAEEDWEELDDNEEGEEDSEDATQAEEVDQSVGNAEQVKMKQIQTTKHFRSWMLKARKKVSQKAWQEESQEVKERVLKAIEEEKAEMLAMLDMEKEGLERDPEQRQL